MPDALVVPSGSFRKGWSTRKAIIFSKFTTLAISKNTGGSLATAGTINHRPRDTIMKTLARILPSLSLALAFSVHAQSSVTLYGVPLFSVHKVTVGRPWFDAGLGGLQCINRCIFKYLLFASESAGNPRGSVLDASSPRAKPAQ